VRQVGPYHNPQETYSYYTLPFCRPPKGLLPHTKWAGLSEVLDGVEFHNSDLPIPFKSE
jgi:transmembrane 9 superfamily protein 3